MRKIRSKSGYLPNEWTVLETGEKVKALRTFKTHNISKKFGLKVPKSGLATIVKGSIGIVIGLTSPTSLSSAHVARFGRRYVLIYDYNFTNKELISLKR